MPIPSEVKPSSGNFIIHDTIHIVVADSLIPIVNQLKNDLSRVYDLHTVFTSKGSNTISSSIKFETDPFIEKEGYVITIEPTTITIKAKDKNGFYYATQSLFQIIELKTEHEPKNKINCMRISDSPRYSWRALSIDEVHFFAGKEEIKKQIDMMGKLKMNHLIWYLVGEDASRININEILQPFSTDQNKKELYYSVDDLQEITEYASMHSITVVPQIDLPGYFSTDFFRNNINKSHINLDTQTEYIINELSNIFPSQYLHLLPDLSSDEFDKKYHTKQDLINNISKKTLSQAYASNLCKIVNKHEKKLLIWDDMLSNDIPADCSLVIWHNQLEPVLLTQALEIGYNVILSPIVPAYLNKVKKNSEYGIMEAYKVDLNDVYSLPDSIAKLISPYIEQISGLQAVLETSNIETDDQLEYILYPRLLAIAENAWTEHRLKDYGEFEVRTALFYPIFQAWNIYYYDLFDPTTTPQPMPANQDSILKNDSINQLK